MSIMCVITNWSNCTKDSLNNDIAYNISSSFVAVLLIICNVAFVRNEYIIAITAQIKSTKITQQSNLHMQKEWIHYIIFICIIEFNHIYDANIAHIPFLNVITGAQERLNTKKNKK